MTKVCSFQGCGRRHEAKGLCGTHYHQSLRGATLTTITRSDAGAPRGPRCTYLGCRRVVVSGGLCIGHAAQRASGESLSALSGCLVVGCGRAHEAQGMCSGHRSQVRLGKPLSELKPMGERRPRGSSIERDDGGRKFCGTCEMWRPEDAFTTEPRRPDGLAPRCKQCIADEGRFRNYRITPAQYAELLQAQGGTCALCPVAGEPGSPLAVDHDHQCCPSYPTCGTCVRGLLCRLCNTGLGALGDSPERLRKAASYVQARMTNKATTLVAA